MSTQSLETRYLDNTPKWKRYGRPDLGAPTPPPPVPTASWLSGASCTGTADGTFATWRGRPLDIVGTWADTNVNTQINGPQWAVGSGSQYANWQGPVDIATGGIYTQANGGDTGGDTWAKAATLALYITRWTASLNNLKAAWGSRPYSNLYIRFAHEFNGDWSEWQVVPSQAANFVAAFQRYSNLAKTILPGCHVVWSPGNGTSGSSAVVTSCWPGSQYADTVAIDYYNSFPFTTTQSGWDAHLMDMSARGEPVGPGAWLTQANAWGVQLAFGEWGAHGELGEAPAWIHAIYLWIKANAGTGPGKFRYEVYFNLDGVGTLKSQLYPPTGVQPLTAAQYKTDFGSSPTTPPPGVDPRESLIYGTYIPGLTPNTVGYRDFDPVAGEAVVWTNEYGNTTTKIFTPVVGTTYRNTIFWCKVAHSNTAGGTNKVWYENCRFANRKPEDMYAAGVATGDTNGGCVQNFGSNPAQIFFKNCTFDPGMWYDAGLSAYKGHPLNNGIHGGNIVVQQCEFKNCQDGVNYVGPNTDGPAGAASCLFEANWVHKNYYLDPWTTVGSPASQDTHSDGFQMATGRNITIRYNMIGGTRDMVGYTATPIEYNSGDDCSNAAAMIAQEGGTSYSQHVGPLYFGYNWMGGGAATLNIFTKNGNTGADWTFERNKIMLRGSTGQPGGAGYDILRSTSQVSSLLNNVKWDPSGSINGTGVAAIIVNGA